jgi:hypothetical protein
MVYDFFTRKRLLKVKIIQNLLRNKRTCNKKN